MSRQAALTRAQIGLVANCEQQEAAIREAVREIGPAGAAELWFKFLEEGTTPDTAIGHHEFIGACAFIGLTKVILAEQRRR